MCKRPCMAALIGLWVVLCLCAPAFPAEPPPAVPSPDTPPPATPAPEATPPAPDALPARVSCAFEASPLSEVLAFFRSQQKLNLVCALPMDQQEETLITAQVKDQPPVAALRRVVWTAGLRVAVDDSIIYVAPARTVHTYQRTGRRSYNIQDVQFPLLAAPSSSSNGDDDDDNNNNDRTGRSAEDVMAILVLFTGPRNWDYVGRIPANRTGNNDTNNSGGRGRNLLSNR